MIKKNYFYILSISFLLLFPQAIFRMMEADIFTPLSDFSYFFIYYALVVMSGVLGVVLLLSYGYVDFFKWRFKLLYLVGLVLLFVLNTCWSKLAMPLINNYFGDDSLLRRATMYSIFSYRLLISDLVIAPFFEEVYRTVVFALMEKWKRYYLDVVLSALLFSVNHFIYYGWSNIDFITYLVPGLFIGLYFRKTNSIYFLIIYHILWNSVPYLMGWR